jgi:hypothetical protein
MKSPRRRIAKLKSTAFETMVGYRESRSRQGVRWLTFALLLIGSVCSSFAHAACKPAGASGALELPLSPVRITVPKGAPVGALLGSAHAAAVRDISFDCTGAHNVRELRVLAPTDVTSGLGDVYATSLAGIGFRIVTRGGSFAGIDDGPRNAAYKVDLPADANRLTGFAVDIDFVKIGAGQGGALAPGKLASVIVGGTTLVDVVVPDGGITVDVMQCSPLTAGGEVSAGAGTMGAFSQEAVVIQTGCSNVNVAVGLGTTYVYGSRPALIADAPAGPKPHALSAAGAVGVVVHRGSNGTHPVLRDDAKSDANETNSMQLPTGGAWSGGGATGYSAAGNVWGGGGPRR